jgi:hypothetical protein
VEVGASVAPPVDVHAGDAFQGEHGAFDSMLQRPELGGVLAGRSVRS